MTCYIETERGASLPWKTHRFVWLACRCDGVFTLQAFPLYDTGDEIEYIDPEGREKLFYALDEALLTVAEFKNSVIVAHTYNDDFPSIERVQMARGRLGLILETV